MHHISGDMRFSEMNKTWTDEKKIFFFLCKLSPADYEKYCNYILPKKPGNITFDETVLILSRIFSEKSSLFYMLYQCLNFMKKTNDYVTYTAIVNRECERFKLSELTTDNLKCFIFVEVLTAEKYSEIWSHILSKLEAYLKLMLKVVAKECEMIMNLKHSTVKIQGRDVFQVHSVHQRLKEGRKKVISML